MGESLKKQNNFGKYQRVQRMINIKISEAFSTLSYEASCVLAGVRPIRLAIEEKVERTRQSGGATCHTKSARRNRHTEQGKHQPTYRSNIHRQ